jgi:integrase
MRGSVVKRGATYAVVLEVDRDPATGKRRRKWHSGYRTKRAAERALAEMVDAVNRGTYVPKTKQTVADFAAEWLAAITPTVRPATHYSYARNLRLHVEPYVGSVALVSVDAGTLNALYAGLLADGRRNQAEGGLSPRSVRYVHTIVHRMLKDAVRWGRLARNAADAADPPRPAGRHAQMATWTADETGRFLTGVRDDRLGAAFLLLATTGARRGEVLGLRWADVDLDAGRVAIRQTVIAVHHKVQLGEPKTAHGRRTLDLDPFTVAALREQRKRQAAERLLMGRRLDRSRAGVLPGRRRTAAPRAVLPHVRDPCSAARATADPAARSAARLGDDGPRGRGAPEGGAGAAGPRHHRDHARHVQPRHAWHACRCGRADRGPHLRDGAHKWVANR